MADSFTHKSSTFNLVSSSGAKRNLPMCDPRLRIHSCSNYSTFDTLQAINGTLSTDAVNPVMDGKNKSILNTCFYR